MSSGLSIKLFLRSALTLGALLTAGLVAGATAVASTTLRQTHTTVGQTGTPPNDVSGVYGGGDEIVNTTPSATVSARGVITRFKTKSTNCDVSGFGFTQGTYNFQVLRPKGTNQYKVLGDTGNKTDRCNGARNSYSVHIPVKAGDLLGVYVVTDWFGRLGSGTDMYTPQPEPTVGQTVTVSLGPENVSPDESATLALDCVVPNLKGKTLKAAKKALKANSCTLGQVRPKGQTTGKVKNQSPAAGRTLKPGAKVNVRLG
jgi:hypothetical protein